MKKPVVKIQKNEMHQPTGRLAEGWAANNVFNAAGTELEEFRKTKSLPLQECSVVLSSKFKLKCGYKHIALVVMPKFTNPSSLTPEDRAKLRNCYDTVLTTAKELNMKKIVLPILGLGCYVSIDDAIDVALTSAFEAIRNGDIEVVEDIFFTESRRATYKAFKAHRLYPRRKEWSNWVAESEKIAKQGKCSVAQKMDLPSRASDCEGTNTRLLTLIGKWNPEARADLLGCSHEADLLMCRIGVFNADWDSEEMSNFEVCNRHLKQFLYDWKSPFWRNIKQRAGNYFCSFPEHTGQLPIVSISNDHLITKADSQRWMSKKNSILAVGTPVCDHDMKFLRSPEFDSAMSQQEAYLNRARERSTSQSKKTPPPARKTVLKALHDAVMNLYAVLKIDSNVDSRKSFGRLRGRQRREKKRLARIGVEAICEVLANGDMEELKEEILNGGKMKPTDSCAPLKKLLTEAADLYERSPSKQHRLFILSSVAKVELSVLQQFFHGLTSYYHKKARKLQFKGTLDIPKKLRRIRYEAARLDKLLEFILSPLVVLNMPFDERQERMDDGPTISMPNLMRLQTIDEVYRMYLSWLEEEGLSHMALKETTAKYIIQLVAPTRRKNLTCVDEKIADGLKAFDEYFDAVNELLKKGKIEKSLATRIIKQLQSGVSYLRGDFKVRIINGKCSELEYTLKLVEEVLEGAKDLAATPAEKEHFSTLHEECMINYIFIQEMKKHQIRAALSHQEKSDFLASLSTRIALVTLDWAQKLTPMYAREKQCEYYAKIGIAYHISHAETVIDGESAQHLSVHIFKPGEKQDGTAVALIVEDFLKELKKMGIKRIMLRSDCAGCYRNAALISALYRMQGKIGIRIDGLMFSEAQAGKGPCDRGSSLIKGKGRDTVTSTRGKIETKEEFFDALTSGKLLNGVSIHLCSITNRKKENRKMKDITKYTSFEFEKGDEIRLRRHRSIGKGLPYDISSVPPCTGKLEVIKSGGHTVDCPDLFWLTKTSHQARSSNAPTTPIPVTTDGMLHCPIDGCIKEYRSFTRLGNHVVSGKHEYELERKTIHDYCSEMASLSIGMNAPTCPLDRAVASSVHSTLSSLPQGWALRERKATNKNDARARELVREFFHDKRSNDLKANPHEALTFMKNARKADGSLEVSPKNRLTITQIKSIFTGLLKKEKPKGKKSKPAPASTDESSDESSDDEDAVPEDFDDTDDEEFLRELIHEDIEFEMEIKTEKDKKTNARKRRSVSDQ